MRTGVVFSFFSKINYFIIIKGYLFFIMEFMSGGNLKFHLDKIKQFSEIQVKFYSAQIISGLSYLHKKDLIH